ncbi:MAG: fused MFS/spermidine synthase [Gemmatimonadaceae bacterium]|nr:fused MFS/spermidine synthase [Gemmatimonadaceae bacterium]
MTLLQLMLTVAFVLSGAAGLIYEAIWSRYLGLFVGHSAYAQTIVLVIFLGGMSAGAAWVARRSATLTSPLMWYARAEAACGVLGLVFHGAFGVVTAFCYDTLFPALPGGTVLLVVKWVIAALLILPQSVLLGTTFPLMSAGFLRAASPDGHTGSGKVLANLYFANSFGAAVGVLIAGFVLISAFGLPGTLQTAAILNVVVAAMVVAAVQFAQEESDAPVDPAPAAEADAAPVPAHIWRILLIVAAGTAVSSFIYEIAWVRMLSLVLGSATHSFELMLSAFILGLSLGALWVRTRADGFRDPMRALAVTQWIMGALAIATMSVYMMSFDWMASLLETLAKTDEGYRAFSLTRYAICLAVMLPATFCAGITLPLITRMLLSAGAGERAIGAVYSINTLGSIVGAALAALVLMPLIGLKALLVSGAVIDMALGVWLMWLAGAGSRETRKFAVGLAGATVFAVLGATLNAPFTREILTSGVYRYGRVEQTGRNVVFYRDGRTATVSVRKTPGRQQYALSTNGKPDASLSEIWFDTTAVAERVIAGDESTQLLLPMVVLAHVPRAAEGAVIGQGSGMSSHFLLGSPHLKRLTTIDIEPEMVRGSRLFDPVNRRVFDDPRSEFVYDDARSVFASARRQYDFILSEPSNPWVSGVSGLFTDEFYRRARQYLTPHGIFGQWLHLYEINDELILSVVRALHRNFPSYRIYLTNDVDILIVASADSALPEPDWSVFEYPKVVDDLRRFRRITPEALEGTVVATNRTLAPIVRAGGLVNSDFHPVLDLGAERTRYRKDAARGFMDATGDRFDLLAALDERRIGFGTETREGLDLPRVLLRARSARLRAGEPSPASDTIDADRLYRLALNRQSVLRELLESSRAPVDWFTWFRMAIEVERDHHAGLSGVVDSAFYDGVERYMVRWRAPEAARSAWRFMRAAGTYDWPGVAAEVTPQLKSRVAGHTWLPLEILGHAGVLALVRTGDRETARKMFEALESYSAFEKGDLRSEILRALVARRKAVVPR